MTFGTWFGICFAFCLWSRTDFVRAKTFIVQELRQCTASSAVQNFGGNARSWLVGASLTTCCLLQTVEAEKKLTAEPRAKCLPISYRYSFNGHMWADWKKKKKSKAHCSICVYAALVGSSCVLNHLCLLHNLIGWWIEMVCKVNIYMCIYRGFECFVWCYFSCFSFIWGDG